MKKVLIVTYYWPPAGGPGVQRWLNFVKYLPENEINAVVYVPEDPHYPIKDESLLKEVPDNITIYRQPIWEPYKLSALISETKTRSISSGMVPSARPTLLERFFLWVRGNLFIPDARKFWVAPSVRFLSEIIAREKVEVVITTGPPHSVHLIGMGLKLKSGIRWIADFRDPWTSIGYHKALRLSKRAQKKHRLLEKKVLNSADEVLVTSNTTKEEFSAITTKPVIVITNGYDKSTKAEVELDTHFTLSHIGSLLSERNPVILWEAISELTREEPSFKEKFRLELIGVVSDEIIKAIKDHGLEENTIIRPYLPHAEAVKAQRCSQVLLLIEINSEQTKGIIPGKLFEYMAARRPVLAIGPEGWEAGELISKTNSGEVLTYKMGKELKATLLKWFKSYKEGKLDLPAQNIEEYSRKELTRKLAQRI